ncbi:CRISPR type III-A/MTUBE-associated RAMP protein Csm5 [Cyclonatronum proteinivorum]|uniref:CRISPR type III-A/MTUBE-associated RAMP protein Csm5 n=1 Tax=Cyclonatronum proteinivorum TaxID=1457365 RepID=A0A345UPN9_9BACT|nr:type III-A CRISPR-associated RAMP protein Csm5 [Cyclonatronum proteinivorum]AXJ02441.1 CRISPR type III-A/MTUBE-associated RAMP protein Csm5 [Cyclonatronum proteinivorum]
MNITTESLTGIKSKVNAFTFEVYPFTPVFVGSGDKLIRNLDFITQGKSTYLLDLHKLFSHEIDNLAGLEQAITKQNLNAYIAKRNLKLANFVKRTLVGHCEGNELFMNVLTGTGDPMYPGSSVKGSLKSAVFHHYFVKKNIAGNRGRYRQLITQNGRPKNDKYASQDLQNELLVNNTSGKRGLNPNYDIGRVFRPADCVFGSGEMEVFNVAVVNETRNSFMWKKLGVGRNQESNFRDLREATKIALAGVRLGEDVFAQSTISIDQSAKEAINWPDDISVRMLAECCNKLSLELIEEDLVYFEDAAKDIPSLNKVVEELETIQDEIKAVMEDNKGKDNVAWLQRMGWGSGWLSMTGAHATDKNELLNELRAVYTRLGRERAEFPKSRKVVLSRTGQPQTVMGWLMVEQK